MALPLDCARDPDTNAPTAASPRWCRSGKDPDTLQQLTEIAEGYDLAGALRVRQVPVRSTV